jgi:UDP-N-acetylmuramoylalanine--D-glutamate ligase
MIILDHYAGRTVAVLGLGASGTATVHALNAGGAHVVAWDDKADGACLPIPLTHYDAWDWDALECIVISPGVPLHHPTPHPAVQLAHTHGVRITSDITLLMESCAQAQYIGITGTNGKSTTTALMAHCLRTMGANVQCGGNIGVPALALEPLDEHGIYVLELSSYQLDSMDSGVLDIACLTNITPDHIDRHGCMDGYVHAKERIFRGQHPQAHAAIIAIDDEHTRHIAQHRPHAMTVSAYGTQGAAWSMDGSDMLDARAGSGEMPRYDLSIIPSLLGAHNHQNALIVMAACVAAGFDPNAIYDAMQSFGGLAHRMERVRMADHVLCVNDSKATNADAAAKSLGAYDNIYWIVGGVAKAGGIESLAEYMPRVRHAYCIGEAAEAFAQTLRGFAVECTISGTLERAVQDAFLEARGREGAVILLAPACASFDQFKNFEQRGDRFKVLVENL